jgi:hypothetical protein
MQYRSNHCGCQCSRPGQSKTSPHPIDISNNNNNNQDFDALKWMTSYRNSLSITLRITNHHGEEQAIESESLNNRRQINYR